MYSIFMLNLHALSIKKYINIWIDTYMYSKKICLQHVRALLVLEIDVPSYMCHVSIRAS